MPLITISSRNISFQADPAASLLTTLREHGIYPDAPCGGTGRCGKCRILADGNEVLACRTYPDRDMEVELPEGSLLSGTYGSEMKGNEPDRIRSAVSCQSADPFHNGFRIAFDIGTTTLVCSLSAPEGGSVLTTVSRLNPQTAFGADVISRIRAARQGSFDRLTEAIRLAMTEMIRSVCSQTHVSPDEITVLSVVGNPAMQQLFLHIDPENLAAVPFLPVLTRAQTVSCREILPICPNAILLTVPDISGFIGADTIGCLLAAGLYEQDEITLLVDIGTNSEMVLGNKDRLISCAAAAGPALEGAAISCGMRADTGAVDHVRLTGQEICCSVIGGGPAKGICGSGLIDAAAVGLRLGLINSRGRIQNEAHVLRLTQNVCLTQEDIRQLQLAKGAIRAGISLLARQFGIEIGDIRKVLLTGAFGSYLDPESACRIGLLPGVLQGRIQTVGNAAISGARLLAGSSELFAFSQELRDRVEYLELSGSPDFPKAFARGTRFEEE